MKKLAPRTQTFLAIFIGGVFLCVWAWYNGYPFVYPDTGAYLFSGFGGKVPLDRPLTYGLFARHASLAESAYWIVLAQGLLTAGMIWGALKYFTHRVQWTTYFAVLAGLIAFTHVSIYVSYLLPDFSTPVFFGLSGMLLFAPLSRRAAWVWGVAAWVVMVMHLSNLLSGLMIVGMFSFALFSAAFRRVMPVKKLLMGWAFVVSGWLGVMTIHKAYGGPFKVSQASHIFMMHRLHEFGMVKGFLDKNCADSTYSLCRYKDAIPPDFIWDSNSPASKDGGWLAHEAEYNEIIRKIVFSPENFRKLIGLTANGMFQQFFYFRVEDIGPQREHSPPYAAIKAIFPAELNMYTISHQNHRNHFLDFDGLNWRQFYLFLACVILAAALWTHNAFRRSVSDRAVYFFNFVLLSLFVNAFVCSTFSTVVSRYQGRLVWLWIFAGLLVLLSRKWRYPDWIAQNIREDNT